MKNLARPVSMSSLEIARLNFEGGYKDANNQKLIDAYTKSDDLV